MIAVNVRGDHWEPVVWRNAVTVRATSDTGSIGK